MFGSSYIQNIFKMQQVKAAENFRLLRKPVDHKAWGPLPPTIINAFYEPPLNQISNVYFQSFINLLSSFFS